MNSRMWCFAAFMLRARMNWMPICLGISILFCGSIELNAQTAEKIYHNGKIITVDDAVPIAEAVAVRDGKILAVGLKTEVLKTSDDKTELIDLQGRTMLPGFVDAHGHVMGGGLQALSANLLSPPDGEVRDIASLQQTLRDWIKNNQQAVEKIKLVVGFGYDNAQLAELRHPNRDDLDVLSQDVPIVLVHQSGHIISVNSKALELGGITKDTANPTGGVIRRRQDSQEPNGVLEETAAFPLLFKLIGRVGPEGAAMFLRAGADRWASYGYTTAQDGRSMPDMLKIMQQVAKAGDLKIDVVAYPDVLVDRNVIKQEFSPNYKNRFRVGGAKLTIDGSPQGFTAWRDQPYYKPVGDYPEGYVGYPAAQAEQVIDAINWAFSNDLQILTHSNGEAASDLLIAAIAAARKVYPQKELRPVLIHGQFLREDQVDSLQKLDILPSLFPMHTYYWGDWHREHTVGPELADDISPTGWCVERGMKFTSHHDAPVANPNSMRVLDATVTRRSRSGDIIGPSHRVDVMTGIKAMTLWSAWQHFEEDRKGSIEVGKLADFVILDKDPTAVDVNTLDEIKVTETIKEGKTIFLSDPAQQGQNIPTSSDPSFGKLLQAMSRPVSDRDLASGPQAVLAASMTPGCGTCICGTLSQLVNAAAGSADGELER